MSTPTCLCGQIRLSPHRRLPCARCGALTPADLAAVYGESVRRSLALDDDDDAIATWATLAAHCAGLALAWGRLDRSPTADTRGAQ